MNKADCPDIEEHGYDAVLNWSKASIIFEEDAWGFSWEYGFITFLSLDKDTDKEAARQATAMTIYLWCKGIRMSLANKLGLAFASPSYFEI